MATYLSHMLSGRNCKGISIEQGNDNFQNAVTFHFPYNYNLITYEINKWP
jgi:hypothetical protein